MDTKLKSGRKLSVILVVLLLAVCSLGMMLTYPVLERQNTREKNSSDRMLVDIEEMGESLALGNYILCNEYTKKTSRAEVLEEFGSSTSFGLLRKYMECGVFDMEGNSLLESTSDAEAERLLDESGQEYGFRAEFEFSAAGELVKTSVTGESLSPADEYSAENLYAGCVENAEGGIVTLERPEAVVIVYGMTEEKLEEYTGWYSQDEYEPYLLIDFTGFQAYAMIFAAAAAAGGLLIPCIPGVEKPKGVIFRIPFEIVGCALLFLAVPLTGIGFVVWHTLNGSLYHVLFADVPALALNFLLWAAFYAVVWWGFSCLREIFTMGTAYWKERTITAMVVRRVMDWTKKRGGQLGGTVKTGAGKLRRFAGSAKRFFQRQYDAMLHMDLKNQSTRAVLKAVAVNFVILAVISCLWFYGIFVLLVYSAGLFLLLRRYLNDLRGKYEILLRTTNRLAEGNLDAPIEGDAGLFNPVQEELKKIRKGFKKAVDEEVKNERMKTELVTNVSHDLRTPLTAIITYTDLLKSEKDEEKRKEYIDVLERKSLRLKVLIEDLFEISKAASGTVAMNYMNVDIVNLLKEVGLENEGKLREANLEVRWKLPEKKIVMWLDSQKTYRIFENLIVNIAKYAMPHTRVYIELEEQESAVRISMKNVSARELDFNPEEITDRFVRGDSSRNTEGSGLGLAIAKSFSQLQHGTLAVSTEADLFRADIMLPKLEETSG